MATNLEQESRPCKPQRLTFPTPEAIVAAIADTLATTALNPAAPGTLMVAKQAIETVRVALIG